MARRGGRVRLDGSEKAPTLAPRIGTPPAQEQIRVTVHLRERDASLGDVVERLAGQDVHDRRYLSRDELAEQYGARPADIEAVRAFAADHDLFVAHVDAGRRTVELSGSIDDMQRAFGTELSLHEGEHGVFRARQGTLTVPAELEPAIVAVLGLDNRPAATPHFVIGSMQPSDGPVNARRAATNGSFDPTDLAGLYDFPANATGTSQTVAVIELGGGFHPSELDQYFTSLGLASPPNVTAVGVGGGSNNPTGNPSGPDGEVVLDIEVIGAVAPGADIVVYFAHNTLQGFADAVLAAVHDSTHQPSIMSISWGLAETGWSVQARKAMDDAFLAAAAVGMTVFAASGDDLSTDGMDDGDQHADYPASSPHVVGCGGTSLSASRGAITKEVVWNAGGSGTGGGVSSVYPVPTYQAGLDPPPTSANAPNQVGRGVPDVAAVADPATGYRVLVDGQSAVVGGTSAVAPLWAGLTARLQQKLGAPLAPLAPILYEHPAAFRDITSGDNGAYAAQRGWDPCTGLGSPAGSALLQAIVGRPATSGSSGSSPGVGPQADAAPAKVGRRARS